MADIARLLEDTSWQLKIEFDPNEGGDGPHIRVNGDPQSFRTLAKLLTIMADGVDTPEHPAAANGWHFALSPELAQLELKNASLIALNCNPT